MASEGVRWLAERASGRPVAYVPGNHEWYARLLPEEATKAESLAGELHVHFLMDAAVTIGDVRFLGATLWTDYELMAPSPLSVERAMMEASRYPNDHHLVDIRPGVRFQPGMRRTRCNAKGACIAIACSIAPWPNRTGRPGAILAFPPARQRSACCACICATTGRSSWRSA